MVPEQKQERGQTMVVLFLAFVQAPKPPTALGAKKERLQSEDALLEVA
jgi:hypothetical protein